MAISILNGFSPLKSSKTEKVPKRLSLVHTHNLIFHINLFVIKFIGHFLALLSPGLPVALGPLLLISVTSFLLVHTLTSLTTLFPAGGRGGCFQLCILVKCWSSLEPVWGPSPLTKVSLGQLIPSIAYRDILMGMGLSLAPPSPRSSRCCPLRKS